MDGCNQRIQQIQIGSEIRWRESVHEFCRFLVVIQNFLGIECYRGGRVGQVRGMDGNLHKDAVLVSSQ